MTVFGDRLTARQDKIRARELRRPEPEVTPAPNCRAAEWYEQTGASEPAIAYVLTAGGLEHVGRLVTGCLVEVYRAGDSA